MTAEAPVLPDLIGYAPDDVVESRIARKVFPELCEENGFHENLAGEPRVLQPNPLQAGTDLVTERRFIERCGCVTRRGWRACGG